MPIFEFSCEKCDNRFEKVQQSDSALNVICPTCGSADVKKEISAFSMGTSSSASCFSGG